MNKADLVNLVAARTELNKGELHKALSAAFDVIIEQVASGRKVMVLGFGSFEPRQRTARMGKNPKTGESIMIPEKRVPVFLAGKGFKDAVRN